MGAEFRENTGEPPRTVIPGIGGTGSGNRSFGLLAVDEKMESVDFVEAKGGPHSRKGTARDILKDGTKGEVLEQGTAAYSNHIPPTRTSSNCCATTPTCGNGSRTGRSRSTTWCARPPPPTCP